MSKDGAIAPAIELVESMIARVPWHVTIPDGYEDELKDKKKYLEQVINDMETPWYQFIRQLVNFNTYGFSAHEIILRYRKKSEGSKYNDGLVGIRDLPPRGQASITRWKFDKKTDEILGLYQSQHHVNEFELGSGVRWGSLNDKDNLKEKFIPRKKFLLFRVNPEKDSPIGKSPLVGAHTAWKYKIAYQEMEASGVVQETNGLKVLYMPSKYMSTDASPEDKATYQAYQTVLNQMHMGKSSGMILPLITDERGNKLFELKIENVTGKSSFDIDGIIRRYTLEILTSLFADFLSLGSSGGGSFSLAESKMDVIQTVIEARLNEIKSQINHQLVRTLFEYNGWDTEVMPEIEFGEVGRFSLDEVSKWVQRIKATGMLPRNKETVNWVLGTAKVPWRVPNDLTDEEFDELMGDDTSRSGDSLNTPTGGLNGTAKSVSGEDTSIDNKENA